MKKNLWSITMACALAAAMGGCGASSTQNPSTEASTASETTEAAAETTAEEAEKTGEETEEEAAGGADRKSTASAYDPASFDPERVRLIESHALFTDIEGCEDFAEILEKAENQGLSYANADLGGEEVLLTAENAYEWEEGVSAVVSAEVFIYKDGSPFYVGYVQSGGSGYPLAVHDGYLYSGGNHYWLKYTIAYEGLLLSEEAYVSYDADGTDTYYYRTADTEFTDYEEDEAFDKYDALMREYYEDAEILHFETIGGEASPKGLPMYVYPGTDPYLSAVCDYLVNVIAPDYLEAEVAIPCVRVVDVDDSDPADILVWGDFEVERYDLEDTTLVSQSGGAHPGLMHLSKNEDGSYTVTDFAQVEDGSDYTPSAKQIFGDKYDAFSKLVSDNEDREKVRAEYIQDYVDANGLAITAYQDYGWDPVELKH